MKHLYLNVHHTTQVALTLGMLLTSIGLSSQTLQIHETIHSDKATPVINNTINAPQSSGSITYTFGLTANVSAIKEAYYEIDNTQYPLSWNIDELGDRVNFTTTATIDFTQPGTHSALKATVIYTPFTNSDIPAEDITVTHTTENNVRIWPQGNVEYSGPTPSWGTLSGEPTQLSASVSGGYENGWQYSWSTGATSADISYLATNSTTSVRHDNPTVTIKNLAPDGKSVWQEFKHTYDVPIYPEPKAEALPITPSNTVFAGTIVNLGVTTTGGNPDAWNYNWSGTESNNQPTSTYKAVNTGTTSVNHISTLTVTNQSPDGSLWYNESISYPVTIWPTPAVTLSVPDRTEWINGESIPLSIKTSGGDPSKWTYSWTVDGQSIANSQASFNYSPVNTGDNAANHTVSVTAINTPDGIDEPVSITQSYTCTVYPSPVINLLSIDHQVIYSGTEINLKAETNGGNPNGWAYSWKRNGTIVAGETASLSDAPQNTGSSAATITYQFTATNTCGDNVITLTQEKAVTVWPLASTTFSTPDRTEWINGESVPLSIKTSGGDPSKWTYSWTVDGQTISETGSTYSYIAFNNSNSPAPRTITVQATNTPDGINTPYTLTHTYQCTVYATPIIKEHSIESNAIFNGNTIEMGIITEGGKPDGWTYSWSVNGSPIDNNKQSLTASPVNYSDKEAIFTYTVTATNIYGENHTVLSHDFTVTVWPTPTANLSTPSRVEWLNGEQIPFTVTPTGGDSSTWTYVWTVDNQKVDEGGNNFVYIANNTEQSGVRRTITVTATNTPAGIKQPYTYTNSYSCTVYPTPDIKTITQDKNVTFSGTEINLSIETIGGAPFGWTYSWKKNGTAIQGSNSITDIPTNNGTDPEIYTYIVTATNTVDEQINTLDWTFTVTVWPKATATIETVLPDELLSGDQVQIPISLKGGDGSAWNIQWLLNGVEVQSGPSDTYLYKAFNSNDDLAIENTITVVATNLPEGIDQAYSSTFTHTFNVYPHPSATPITSNDIVTYTDRTLTLGVKYIGGQSSTWNFEWTHNGTIIDNSTATLPVTFENDGNTLITDTYSVTSTNIVNGEIRYQNTEEFNIDIYPRVRITQGQAEWDAYYGATIPLEIFTQGGYPDGWTIEWTDQLPEQTSVNFTIPATNNDKYNKIIKVTATNEYQGEKWFSQTYSFNINCWSTGEVTPAITLDTDYNGNINTTLLTNVKGGYVEGWTYRWLLNGTLQAEGIPSIDINETNYNETAQRYTWTLVATNTLNGVVGCNVEIPFSFNLWPVIETPTSIEVSELNVASGSTITLNVSPTAASGGYMYHWNYNWTANGSALDNNAPIVTYVANIPNNDTMDSEEITFGLNLSNPAPNNGYWFNQDYPTQTIRVYNRPKTPSAITRKGNGTTCTMIALTDLSDVQLSNNNYMFIFGYTDALGIDHSMPATNQRLYRFSSDVYNNPDNNFWVYALWIYDNGVSVTSQRRHLNGEIDDFNGSDFSALGRGEEASADNIMAEEDEVYIYPNRILANLSYSSTIDLDIYNTAGSIIYSKKFPETNKLEHQFEGKSLVPGVYIVSLKTVTSTKIKKVVIK